MSRARLAALALVLGGCDAVTGPDADQRLTAARRRWLTTGFYSYSFEYRRDCYCQNAGRWALVLVTGSHVTSAMWRDTNTPVEPQFLSGIATVPSLFDDIERAFAQQAVLVEVSYDPADGHPTHINVDVSRNIADEEFAVTTRNLQPALSAAGPSAR